MFLIPSTKKLGGEFPVKKKKFGTTERQEMGMVMTPITGTCFLSSVGTTSTLEARIIFSH